MNNFFLLYFSSLKVRYTVCILNITLFICSPRGWKRLFMLLVHLVKHIQLSICSYRNNSYRKRFFFFFFIVQLYPLLISSLLHTDHIQSLAKLGLYDWRATQLFKVKMIYWSFYKGRVEFIRNKMQPCASQYVQWFGWYRDTCTWNLVCPLACGRKGVKQS